jgi:hypothetical protein
MTTTNTTTNKPSNNIIIRFRIHSLALYLDYQLVLTRRFVGKEILPNTPSKLLSRQQPHTPTTTTAISKTNTSHRTGRRGSGSGGIFFPDDNDEEDDSNNNTTNVELFHQIEKTNNNIQSPEQLLSKSDLDKNKEWIFREWREGKSKWTATTCATKECVEKNRDWARAGCMQVLKDVEKLVRVIDKRESLGAYLLLMLPFGIPSVTDANLVLGMSFPQDINDAQRRPVWNPHRPTPSSYLPQIMSSTSSPLQSFTSFFTGSSSSTTTTSSSSILRNISAPFRGSSTTTTVSQQQPQQQQQQQQPSIPVRFVIKERLRVTHITSALEDSVSIQSSISLNVCYILPKDHEQSISKQITFTLKNISSSSSSSSDNTNNNELLLVHECVQRCENNRITFFPPPRILHDKTQRDDEGKRTIRDKNVNNMIELVRLGRTIYVKDSNISPGPFRDVSYRLRRIPGNQSLNNFSTTTTTTTTITTADNSDVMEERLQLLLRVVLKQSHSPPSFIIDRLDARLILPCTEILDITDVHVSSGSITTDGNREIIWSITDQAVKTQGFALLSGSVRTRSIEEEYQDDFFTHETSCALFGFIFRGFQASALPAIDFDHSKSWGGGSGIEPIVEPRIVEADGLDYCVWSPFGQHRAVGSLPLKAPLF